MKTHEFWRERGTGKVWAVELSDGVVVACDGPLHLNEVSAEFLPSYDYKSEGASAIERSRTSLEPLREEDLLLFEEGGGS